LNETRPNYRSYLRSLRLEWLNQNIIAAQRWRHLVLPLRAFVVDSNQGLLCEAGEAQSLAIQVEPQLQQLARPWDD
jgi:hypothetical protein